MVNVIDIGILDSIKSYIYLGLPPEYFTECLICGEDIKELYSKANPVIKRGNIIENMVHFIDVRVPNICKGRENYSIWINHFGFSKISFEHMVAFKLGGGEYWIKKYKNPWEPQYTIVDKLD